MLEQRKRQRAQVIYSKNNKIKIVQYVLFSWWRTYPEDCISWCLWQWAEGHILVIDGMSIKNCWMPAPPSGALTVSSQDQTDLGLCWAAFPCPGAPSTQSLPTEPQSDPSESHAAPYITALSPAALIPRYFYALASFFTLHRTETGEITQHLRKRFDSSTAAPV